MLALQAPRRLTAVTTNANQDQPPPDSANGLTHVDARGQANMVDVGAKPAAGGGASAQATMRLGQGGGGVLCAAD